MIWDFDNSNVTAAWRRVCTLLGLETTAPLYASFDLPPALAANPSPLQQAVRRILEAGLGRWQGLGYDPSVFASLIEHLFAHIAAVYSPPAQVAFACWADQLYVDHTLRLGWFCWAQALIRLAERRDERFGPPVPLPFVPDLNQQVREIVATQFNRSHIEQALVRLEAAPVSELERRVVLYYTVPRQEWRAHFIEELALDLAQAAARATWRRLREVLTLPQCHAFVAWGQQEVIERWSTDWAAGVALPPPCEPDYSL